MSVLVHKMWEMVPEYLRLLEDKLTDMCAENDTPYPPYLPEDFAAMDHKIAAVKKMLAEKDMYFATYKEIKEATEEYGSGDVEIDEEALVSRVDDEGAWVSAWVWVQHKEEEDCNGSV